MGVVVATGVAALCPCPAGAQITREGVAGVRLGMNEAAVRDRLGRPTATTGREGGGTKRLDYRSRKVDVLLRGDSVIRVRTTSRGQRTASGVGPGIAQQAMVRKLRGERCSHARGAYLCWVVQGATVSTFTCRNRRLTLAEVGRAEL
jgi:hypothetical protein